MEEMTSKAEYRMMDRNNLGIRKWMSMRSFWAERREYTKDQTGELSVQFGLEYRADL